MMKLLDSTGIIKISIPDKTCVRLVWDEFWFLSNASEECNLISIRKIETRTIQLTISAYLSLNTF